MSAALEDALSLADLNAHDPHPKRFSRETRYCCPLPGCNGKPIDANHQSLSVNSEGLWKCHRCGESGLIAEKWTKREEQPGHSRRAQRTRSRLRAMFEVKEPPKAPDPEPNPAKADTLKKRLEGALPIPGTPAESYLLSRGLPASFTRKIRALYQPEWMHRREENGHWTSRVDRRVVFPIRDREQKLVAIQARAIDPDFTEPKAFTIGDKKRGLFATPGALEAEVLVITEAAIDALSLAACGVPAVALCGTSWPEWLIDAAAFKVVLIAFDNDEAGNAAAEKLSAALSAVGAKPYRLRPSAKDWNEDLQILGAEAMTGALASVFASLNLPIAAGEGDLPQAVPISNPTISDTEQGAIEENALPTDAQIETASSCIESKITPAQAEAAALSDAHWQARLSELKNVGCTPARRCYCGERNYRWSALLAQWTCRVCLPNLPLNLPESDPLTDPAEDGAILDLYPDTGSVLLPFLRDLGLSFQLGEGGAFKWSCARGVFPAGEAEALISRHRSVIAEYLEKEHQSFAFVQGWNASVDRRREEERRKRERLTP